MHRYRYVPEDSDYSWFSFFAQIWEEVLEKTAYCRICLINEAEKKLEYI